MAVVSQGRKLNLFRKCDYCFLFEPCRSRIDLNGKLIYLCESCRRNYDQKLKRSKIKKCL